MMLRRGETLLYVFSTALLVALPVATLSLSYPFRMYLEDLSSVEDTGGLYLVLQGSALSDSILDPGVVEVLRGFDHIGLIVVEGFVDDAILSLGDGGYPIHLRFVDDLKSYSKLIDLRVEGRVPACSSEVLVGVSLARLYSIRVGDRVGIILGSRSIDVYVSGLARSNSQCDYEVIAPMGLAEILGFDRLSMVEFRFKPGVGVDDALLELSRILPLDVRVYGTRRIGEYVYGIGEQIARFLYVWIIPVYIVLAVSSYISSMSLISGSAYELSIIKDLGAGRATVSLSILVYVALTSIIGSMLGLSIGLAGVQVASRIIGWIHPSISLTPILNVYDALIVFILSVTVSILGSMPHILGWVRMGSMGGYV